MKLVLTEKDIKHLLKSEEDIREGRVYTEEEVFEYLKRECGFKEYNIPLNLLVTKGGNYEKSI